MTILRQLLPLYDNKHHCLPYPRGLQEDDVVNAVILDTETTGLVADVDDILQLAILPFQFHRATGRVLLVQEMLDMYQDPGRPIPPEATAVHHITDEMVAGKSIDWQLVGQVLDGAQVIIAHNAGFDRKFVDRRLNVNGINSRRIWACSYDMLKWDAPAAKLEILFPWLCGQVYGAHRADADTNALLHLLHTQGRLPELWDKARAESYELRCLTDLLKPFMTENNDALKKLGFRFASTPTKHWVRTGIATPEEAAEMVRYLTHEGPPAFQAWASNPRKLFTYSRIPPEERYGIGATLGTIEELA